MSEKRDGVGTEGTIPGDPDGVAAGTTSGDPSTFEPEEDPGRESDRTTARPAAAEAQREESEDAELKRDDSSQPDAGDERPPGGIGAVDGGSGGNQPDITPDGI